MINMFTERGQTDLKPSTATSSCSSLDSQYEPISRLCISGRQILKKTKQDSHDVKVNMSEGVGDSLCADGRYGVVLQSGCNYYDYQSSSDASWAGAFTKSKDRLLIPEIPH